MQPRVGNKGLKLLCPYTSQPNQFAADGGQNEDAESIIRLYH